jgi:carotenoid cleavage dioxygenase
MTTPTHHYLDGNFGPVQEEITAVDLPVTGSIPAELDGRLLRNGPNPIGTPDPSTYHWFLGDGMVHGLRLRDGKAEWYRNRWVRSPEVAAALGEPTPPSAYPDDVSVFGANTNVIGHAGRTLAIVEAGSPPVELTDELDTIGATNFSGTLEHPFSAHAKRDPGTGELHVVAYYWGWGNKIRYMSIGTDGRVARSVDVETPGSPMVHDMAFTEKYALLFDLPVTFNLDLAMSGRALPYAWNDEYGARIGLLPLRGAADGSDVQWFDIEPCFFYHPLNAYDLDDGRVVLDAVRHPKTFATDAHGPNEGATRLDRWTLDPAEGKVLEETLNDRSQEFPRLNETLQGRRNRYGYGVGTAFELDQLEQGPALKHDLVGGTTVEHDYGPGRVTLEPVFVPREGATAEDDGWVISYVHDNTTNRADVVILDAQDFTGSPVATVHLPVRVPYGFHGNWIPTP